MSVAALGYVGVSSPAVDEWTWFAPEILGTPVWRDADGAVHVRWDERIHRLILHPGPRNRLEYIGWEVSGPETFRSTVDRLKTTGVSVEKPDDGALEARQVEELARFRDPWGMVHEIFYGQRTMLSFRSTRDVSGFVTGDLGMGHVVLAVPDLQEAVRFFTEVMEFRVSDFIDLPFPLAFFHCNPRHHSLAVGQAGPVRGLHHLMIEVRDLNDLGRTYELCKRKNVPFAQDLGRHTNDWMLSFYVRTPSGFEIEYGWGGRLIHDEKSWSVTRLPEPSFWGHDALIEEPCSTMESLEGPGESTVSGRET